MKYSEIMTENRPWLSVTIDCQACQQGIWAIEVIGALTEMPGPLVLEALTVGNGVTVTGVELEDEIARPQPITPHQNQLPLSLSSFRLRYTVQSQYRACVGADRQVYFTYPFANEDEFFIGAGILPYPANLSTLAHELTVQVELINLPGGWQTFSNGPLNHPAKLDSFFLYAAPDLRPQQHTFAGQGHPITFHLLAPRGRELPLPFTDITTHLDNTLIWLEQNLAPYQQASEIFVLFLQAAADFETQTNRQAFATGENVLNGIVTYAPNDPTYLQRLFGQSDYVAFLRDGLAHELVHTYTTTAWQGKYKAVLFPAPDCPPQVQHLLGEALAGYIHRLYMRQQINPVTGLAFPDGFTQDVAFAYEQQKKRGRNHPFLDLFLFDRALRQKGMTLLALVGVAMRERQLSREPYLSLDLLLRGSEAGERGRDLLLPPTTPDYASLLDLG